jgi:hypothetical protein
MLLTFQTLPNPSVTPGNCKGQGLVSVCRHSYTKPLVQLVRSGLPRSVPSPPGPGTARGGRRPGRDTCRGVTHVLVGLAPTYRETVECARYWLPRMGWDKDHPDAVAANQRCPFTFAVTLLRMTSEQSGLESRLFAVSRPAGIAIPSQRGSLLSRQPPPSTPSGWTCPPGSCTRSVCAGLSFGSSQPPFRRSRRPETSAGRTSRLPARCRLRRRSLPVGERQRTRWDRR